MRVHGGVRDQMLHRDVGSYFSSGAGNFGKNRIAAE
jgi:hypothetical protein